jgi:hypothetical protein
MIRIAGQRLGSCLVAPRIGVILVGERCEMIAQPSVIVALTACNMLLDFDAGQQCRAVLRGGGRGKSDDRETSE